MTDIKFGEALKWYVAFVLAALCLAALVTRSQAADLPDPRLTPGVAGTMIAAQLCDKSFRTGSVRSVPQSVKQQVYAEYGVKCRPGKVRAPAVSCSTYEVDHLISLEIGGTNDIKNLWPQHYSMPLGARVKDKLENRLHVEVCAGKMNLVEVQSCISSNWIICFKSTMGRDAADEK
jgi:hypothetical protein